MAHIGLFIQLLLRFHVFLQLLLNMIYTRSSGPYRPFLLAPAEGFGAFGPHMWPSATAVLSFRQKNSFLHKQMTEK